MSILCIIAFFAGCFMVLVFPSVGAICFVFSLLCAMGAIEKRVTESAKLLKSIDEALRRTPPPDVIPEKPPLIIKKPINLPHKIGT